MRTRVHYYIVAVAAAWLVVGACSDHRAMPDLAYYEFQPVDAHEWRCTDTLHFVPDTATIAADNTLSLCLRLGQQFKYRDLWLVCEQRSDSLLKPHRDTVHFILADANGRWQTTGVVLHEASQRLHTLSLKKNESPEFLVYHIMREQGIQGIFDVGLRLEPIKN